MNFLLNPITAQKMGNLQITVTGLLFIVLGKSLDAYVAWKQHFGALTVNFLVNQITTHKMATLKNTVIRLRIIVLS